MPSAISHQVGAIAASRSLSCWHTGRCSTLSCAPQNKNLTCGDAPAASHRHVVCATAVPVGHAGICNGHVWPGRAADAHNREGDMRGLSMLQGRAGHRIQPGGQRWQRIQQSREWRLAGRSPQQQVQQRWAARGDERVIGFPAPSGAQAQELMALVGVQAVLCQQPEQQLPAATKPFGAPPICEGLPSMRQQEKLEAQRLQSLLLHVERHKVDALDIRKDPILNITGTRTGISACTTLQTILS